MFQPMRRTLAILLLAASPAARAAGADPITLVACAPGYPGSSAEAEPAMKAFAGAVEAAAGWPAGSLSAVYASTESAGLARLRARDAALAIVPLPFLVQHGDALALSPRLEVEQRGVGLTETWSLVAKKGRVRAPADLASFTVMSTAGYAPGFVRAAPGAWGRVPDAAKVAFTPQVLSALRRASAGEDVAVLLDGPQSASLPTLPFAAELEVVARSEPLPSMLLCTVGDRLPAKRWTALSRALERLPSTRDGAAALEGLRMVRFVPVDAAALAAAQRRGGAHER
jgi:hypothetical protein